MTGDPAVSVVVPAFNAVATIADCVDSVLAQRYPRDKLELIVVDNGSTDSTTRVLRSYDGDIRVLNERTRGAAAARNQGIAHAQGELVAFIDADCVADEHWLRHLVRRLEDPSVAIVGGAIRATRPANVVELFGETVHDNRKSIEVFEPPYVITMNCCVSTDVLNRLNLFDAAFRRSHDVELSYRAVQAGCKLVFADDAIVYHRHPRTLPALFKKGFQHGFHSIRVLKRHHRLVSADGRRRRLDGRAYVRIAGSFLNALTGPRRSEALCSAVFNSGKRVGKVSGSIRFGYLDL